MSTYVIRNDSVVWTTWLKVQVRDDIEEIGLIEVYEDAACERLLVDDVHFSKLPRHVQRAIHAEIDWLQHLRRKAS